MSGLRVGRTLHRDRVLTCCRGRSRSRGGLYGPSWRDGFSRRPEIAEEVRPSPDRRAGLALAAYAVAVTSVSRGAGMSPKATRCNGPISADQIARAVPPFGNTRCYPRWSRDVHFRSVSETGQQEPAKMYVGQKSGRQQTSDTAWLSEHDARPNR